MGVLHRPPPHVLGGAFKLNRASPQAQGLVFSLPAFTTTTSTVRDVVGNNHGTMNNGATSAVTARGRAIAFDGSDDTVTVPNSTRFDALTSVVTLSAWFYARSWNTYWALIDKSRNDQWSLLADYNNSGGQQRFIANIAGSREDLTVFKTISVATWYHLVGVYDGAYQRLYLDGVEIGNQAKTGALGTSTSSMTLGQLSGGFVSVDGYIHDVRVYSRAVPAAEVWDLYANPWDLYAPNWQQDEADVVAAAATYPSRLLLLGVG